MFLAEHQSWLPGNRIIKPICKLRIEIQFELKFNNINEYGWRVCVDQTL